MFEARFKIDALKRKLKAAKTECRALRVSCQRYDNVVKSLQQEVRERKKKGDDDELRHVANVRDLTNEVETMKSYLKEY